LRIRERECVDVDEMPPFPSPIVSIHARRTANNKQILIANKKPLVLHRMMLID
jgi:hypothetical protein